MLNYPQKLSMLCQTCNENLHPADGATGPEKTGRTSQTRSKTAEREPVINHSPDYCESCQRAHI